MRRFLLCVLACVIALSILHLSCVVKEEPRSSAAKVDTPYAVEGRKDLFRAGRFFFGGQPDEEMLHWMADEGVRVIINLRTIDEMEKLAKEKFSEDSLASVLGMTYLHFPVGGKAGYSPQVVDTFAQALEEYPDTTLIHCRSGGRVSYLWVAYLIAYKDVPINDAVDTGKKMKFKFLLEDLLGYQLIYRKK